METIEKLEAEIEERKARVKALKDIDKLDKAGLESLVTTKQAELDAKLAEYNSFQDKANAARAEAQKLRSELSTLITKANEKTNK